MKKLFALFIVLTLPLFTYAFTPSVSPKQYISSADDMVALVADGRSYHQEDVKKYANDNFANVLFNDFGVSIGVIGKNYQKLSMGITKVSKLSPLGYQVFGESEVKFNRCEYTGILNLSGVYVFDSLKYGVDDEYKNAGLVSQGIAIFDFKLRESETQKYSGVFTGKLYAKWYKKTNGVIYYDDIRNYADGYYNNLYVGTWSEYGSEHGLKSSKTAIWADYSLPRELVPDLSHGAGEFYPNPKYHKYGWADYRP